MQRVKGGVKQMNLILHDMTASLALTASTELERAAQRMIDSANSSGYPGGLEDRRLLAEDGRNLNELASHFRAFYLKVERQKRLGGVR